MDQIINNTSVLSVFDKPGDYWEISKKAYEIIIDNDFHFPSPIEIVIPTYKRPTLLLEALDSAINQDVDFKYLITIIDNDPDSSNENLLNKKEYKNRIRYIRNKENLGLFGNWNRAIQVSRSPFIALLHDDDMLEKNYLSSLIKVIVRYPDAGVVTHTPYQIINENIVDTFSNIKLKIKKNSLQIIDWKDYLIGNITNASCMLISKQKAIYLNGWCSQEYPSADWFFNARMAYNFDVLKYYKPISKYRWEVNATLMPGMKKEFFIKDLTFMVNNLITENICISWFDRLRMEVNLYNRYKKNAGSFDLYNVQFPSRLYLIMARFDKRVILSRFYVLFFHMWNRIERIYNWQMNHDSL